MSGETEQQELEDAIEGLAMEAKTQRERANDAEGLLRGLRDAIDADLDHTKPNRWTRQRGELLSMLVTVDAYLNPAARGETKEERDA